MKLEHLSNTNLYKEGDEIVRLYSFDNEEVVLLQNIISDKILRDKLSIELSNLNFIKSINCTLKFTIGNTDKGILKISEGEFECCLTDNSYVLMISLLQPFSNDNASGYQWLYDLDDKNSNIEFLFSKTGGW